MSRKAFIYTGGVARVGLIEEEPGSGDFVIAADGGAAKLRAAGIKADAVVGDMDSIGAAELEEMRRGGVRIITAPPKKNETDTMLAVNEAIGQKCGEIIIIGGTGGRIDHTLSNLFLLKYIRSRGISALITDGQNRVRYLKNDNLLIPRSSFKYISVIALSDPCRGVSVRGCAYELKKARLDLGWQYAVSNEITGNVALIEVDRGEIFVIESNDVLV